MVAQTWVDRAVTAAGWLGAAALCWHVSVGGGLPKESPASLLTPYATGEARVRVVVSEGARYLLMRPDAAVEIVDEEAGGRLAVVSGGALLTCEAASGRVKVAAGAFKASLPRLLIRQHEGGVITVSTRGGRSSRSRYVGDLEITAAGDGLRVVEHVGLENYVAGVVQAELPDSFPLEAMKAQAIAARTYALFHLGDHEQQGADLCAEVHCQVYRGIPSDTSRPFTAARETAGQVLTWNGMLVDAMYHSACGGSTAAAWEVRQGKLLPYLRGALDSAYDLGGSSERPAGKPYCGIGHQVAWGRRFSWREAEKLVASNLGTVLGEPGLAAGSLKSLRVSSRGESLSGQAGRVEWLEVGTSRGTYRVRGDAVRWLFGNGRPGPSGLRSSDFQLTVERDRKGRPRAVVVKGKGHGHGIGLCQWGARGRAQSGQTAEEILSAYYPGAEVMDLRGYEPDLQVQAQANP